MRIPQEPVSFYIGSFSAAKHRLANAMGAEPPLRRDGGGEPGDSTGVHITVTSRTEVFNTGRDGAAHEQTAECVHDPLLRGLVNMPVACFASARPPRMPSLTDAVASFWAPFE